jgi:hypothetical protein
MTGWSGLTNRGRYAVIIVATVVACVLLFGLASRC